MAFSALSMAHSQGLQDLNALQHYSKALPYLHSSLRSSQDLSSDGALLTHFLLLLYEVRSYEKWATFVDFCCRLQLLSQGAQTYGLSTSAGFFAS